MYVSSIEKLQKLEFLRINRCYGVKEIPLVCTLKRTDLEGMNMVDMPSSDVCTNLTYLDLSSCFRIRNLDFLCYYVSLTHLAISDLTVKDISSLRCLVNLQYLDMSGCTYITDISPLTECHCIQTLFLGCTNTCYRDDGSPIDYTPIGELPHLKEIHVCCLYADACANALVFPDVNIYECKCDAHEFAMAREIDPDP